MKTILLAAGVAAITLSGGQALAAPKSMGVTEPKQPIPYAQLNAYMKASPKQRAGRDWWSGQSMASASTGSAANASATTTNGSDVRSTPDATPSAAAPDATPSAAAPDATTPSTGTVNPAPTAPPGTAPSTTPPK